MYFFLILFLATQTSPVDRAQAGRTLLDEGVDGLKQLLEKAGAPPLTFDQETQIRNLHEVLKREGTRLLSEREMDVESFNRTLADQLFLAAMKFLNPVQRVALGVPEGAANSDLPADPNELREYLRDLTSPASGGERGGVVIDGFSGGRMPNRDEILEIRINDNAFTSEQSQQGRGRTEIRTRGGAGQLNGDATFDFQDESLDARNPFAASRPPYQTRDFAANVSGPLIRNRLTGTLGVFNEFSEEGDTLRAITPAGFINDPVTRPSRDRGFSIRSTTQFGENHAINFSYSYGSERVENEGVGGFGLPEQGATEKATNYNFQIQDVSIVSSKVSHEGRFRLNGDAGTTTPLKSGVHIEVPDAFRGGGSTESGSWRNRTFEFGNLLMYTGNNVSIKTGFTGEYQWQRSEDRENFNGTFEFGSLDDYIAGRPEQYSVIQGNPLLELKQFEGAGFAQSDFRVTPRMTMGFGLRFEAQSNLSDWNNFDPRIGFAYYFGGSTVLRGGSGIFRQRLNIFRVREIRRYEGDIQREIIIRNPSYPDPTLTGSLTIRVPSTINTQSPELTAPYTWNSQGSIESTMPFGLVLTGSYRFVRGIHLFRGRNLNAPLDVTASSPRSCRPGQSSVECVRPFAALGNIIQTESTGLSSTHELEIGFQQRLSFVNVRGNYNANVSYSDVPDRDGGSSLPADNYDLSSEWGPNEPRHSLNSSLNLRLPWKVDADMNFNWDSGEPYSLVTGRDDNRDTNSTDRPPGVRRNSLLGPSFFEVDLNLSKTVTLIPEASGDSNTPVAGGGYFGRRSGIRMTVTAEAENVLNKVNYSRISGVMTSPFFGKPIRARDGRRISLSVRFDF